MNCASFACFACGFGVGFTRGPCVCDALGARLRRALAPSASEAKSRLQGKLTAERTRTSNGWPKLKGKGAAVRHLAPYVLSLAIEHDTGSAHDRRRVAVCQYLVKFYDLLACEGMFMSDRARAEMPEVS